MSNLPTIITEPTPLIDNQAGTIKYYVDISNNWSSITNTNTFPAINNTYLLKDSTGSTLSSFNIENVQDVSSNYQNKLVIPGAVTFDSNGYFYITDPGSYFITIYSPTFVQYLNYTSVNVPLGIKYSDRQGIAYIACLGNNNTSTATYGQISTISPFRNYKNDISTNARILNFFSSSGNTLDQNGTSVSRYYFCYFPMDTAFDNSGNLFVSNFGDGTFRGAISRLNVLNGDVVSGRVLVQSGTNWTGSVTPFSLTDTNMKHPSGIVFDGSSNYLYAACTNTATTSGQISMYQVNGNSVTKINVFNTGSVGNEEAYDISNNLLIPVTAKHITSLTFDSYKNLYFIYCDSNTNQVFVRAISPKPTGAIGSSQILPLLFNIQLNNVTYTGGYNYVYGLSFYDGNIYTSGNVNSTTTNTIEIINSFEFKDVTLQAGDSQTLSIYGGSTTPSFNINVPDKNVYISNETSYTNQAAILTYYDNINNANVLVNTSNTQYSLVDSTNDEVVDNITTITNNEEVYAPYSNELGNLDFPISIDFDSSGNLFILNASGDEIFITIVTPNSGNFQKYYTFNLTIKYPTAIRYNKYDNNMYITSFDSNLYGTIYQVITSEVTYNTTEVNFNIETSIFYTDPNVVFCHQPMDLVFDATDLYVSCAGSLNEASGIADASWNANITKFPVTYSTTTTLGSPTILVDQQYLGIFVSGIEVDSSYVYIVSAPDSTLYQTDTGRSGTDPSYTYYSNSYTNISQFSKTNGKLIQRFNSGYVGKLPDNLSDLSPRQGLKNICSSLKFDEYKNLYYIVYFQATHNQPYYKSSNTTIEFNPTTSATGNYYVDAFVPSSGNESLIFSHKISTNGSSPILGLALYKGNIYVAQYLQDTILKLNYNLSFGNYGFGKYGSQSSLILYKESNSYYIVGGESPIYNISANANILNYAFDTATIVTNPSPCIANCPATLYYYDNPATTSPQPDTSYVLKNSSSKVVSNNYVTPPGNEITIIYSNLDSPKCITTDSEGYLYIANSGDSGVAGNGSIVKSTTSGQIIYTKKNINIIKPYAIKYNSIDGYIYYANNDPNYSSDGIDYYFIYKMSLDGSTFTQVYQDSSFNYLYKPTDMCFDSLGNLYVANGNTTTSSGQNVNGIITKISLSYSSGSASPVSVRVFSDYLSGLTINSPGLIILSGLAIDTITNYLYVVSGANDASGNNINISQIPLTGNDAGKVCRKWQTGKVGNATGQTALNFDGYGNLYYYYYDNTTKVGYLKGFNPYTNTSATYSHTLLGGATSGAYGMVYYDGNFYSTQSAYNSTSETYIDNVIEINASYYFTGVTLQAGQNVLSINKTITNQVIISNIVASASAPKYYTIPAPPVAGQPAQLIFEYDGIVIPINGHNYVVVDSQMNYVSSILNYNSATEPNIYTFTFNNLVLPGGANYLYIFDITTGQIVNIPLCNSTSGYIFIKIPIVCFYKGTKILCAINGKDTYVPIEKIGQGTLVKTYKQGYKRVKYNVMGKLNNTKEHSIDKLFKLSKKRFPELGLTEDLYVTGSHALLYDSLNEREIILMKKVIQYAASNYKSIYNAKIEDKFKLLAYHDERFEEIMMNAVFEIYHLVLENENEKFNYGIYANGVLAESTDELTLMRMKGFEKINKTPESLANFVNAMNINKYPNQLKRALNK